MLHTKYLIIGSSHAGLSALKAIRSYDEDGAITMLTREKGLPKLPIILPCFASGQIVSKHIFFRDQAYFEAQNVRFLSGATAVELDTMACKVKLEAGEEILYEKLLIATGSVPMLPEIPGLKDHPCHVLRSLEDVLSIRRSLKNESSAVILGAGLLGMHATEILAQAGLKVTVVEKSPQVLPNYFEEQAAVLIQSVFFDQGVKIITDNEVTHVVASEDACAVSLKNSLDLSAHLLLVATGVRPCVDLVADTSVQIESGITVDEHMRTNVDNIWAAGDVAQARSFPGAEKLFNGILPDAVEQGWIAGMDMAENPVLKTYTGILSTNTFNFFGNRGFAVGFSAIPQSTRGIDVHLVYSTASKRYQRLVFHNDKIIGASAINSDLDPDIMWQMIRRQVELGEAKEDFVRAPLEVGSAVLKLFGKYRHVNEKQTDQIRKTNDTPNEKIKHFPGAEEKPALVGESSRP